MRFFINGILLVVVLFFLSEALGINLYSNSHNVSAADIPADLKTLSAEQLNRNIRSTTGEKKALFFLYTSTCPYCVRQIEAINEIAKEKPEVRIISLSMDSDPARLQKFLKERPHLAFESHIYTGPTDIRQIIMDLGGNYRGGIPYNAIISEGRIAQDVMGATGKFSLIRALDSL